MIHPAATLLLALGLIATAPVRAAHPSLALSACELEDPLGVLSVAAECGTLPVPENPADPRGRWIRVRLARIPAINRRKRSDPLFVLAGGPGMAAMLFYPSVAPPFARIHRDRDIILLDQRGTGDSNPLDCALEDDELNRGAVADVVAEASACLSGLKPKADVRFYTTSVAVGDLDTVRTRLGYERINLYGVSYGTRVAQQYARRFPQQVRTMILDGVVPPQLALGPQVAINAQNALMRILARCAAEVRCHSRFEDPLATYRELRATLRTHSIPVTLADPTSGERTRIDFGEYQLATVLRLSTYTAEQAALLPLMLDRARHSGDLQPLAAQFMLESRSVSHAIAYGMHNSVVCSEDVPFYPASMARSQIEDTYPGTLQVDALRSICAIWPRGPVDSDLHAPLHTDVPVLLLSGSDDPITPPADAERARGGFAHSVHVLLRGFGHGQLTAPCIDQVMARFLAAGKVEGLDVACTKADVPMPFFTSLGAPAP